jgi:AraC family transcriptional regulator
MPGTEIFWINDTLPKGPVLQASHRTSKLTLARFSHDHDAEVLIESNPEDAFVAIIHVGDMPQNQFYFDQKHRAQPAGPNTSFNFADLRTAPTCRINGRMDNFHLHIPRAALDDLADDADSPPIERLQALDGWDTVDPILDTIKHTLIGAIAHPEETSQLFIDHMMLALHAHLARSYGGMREAARRRSGGLAPWQERRAKELMEANLSNAVTLAEIADECRVSTTHFARAFKMSTGMTPHVWLQMRRVDRARQLMATDLSLAEIALDCGFADQSHFTRVFSQIEGDTPGSWRRYRQAA